MISATLIKSIQDIMRQDDGVDGDAQRLSQLVWMVFLKILDDSERELEIMDESFTPAVPARFQWRSWAADEEGLTGQPLADFINNEMFPALRALHVDSRNPRIGIVREAFADANNYMKSGTLLRQVVNKINSIDFNTTSDRHQFNDLYEKLLRDLQSAGNSGEYYTPRAITQFIVDRVAPRIGESVLDPACGTCGFLANAIDFVRKQVQTPSDEDLIQSSMRGVEKKQLPHLLGLTNMILHGVESPRLIRRGNALNRPLRDYGPGERVDVILTNPPFGGTEEPGIEQNFPRALRTRETADLFLVLIMRLLKPGGRAGMVLPDTTLFGEGVKTRVKEQLLEECNLHTIVRLPGSAFAPYTGIPTNLLFFTKGEQTKEVWFYEHRLPAGAKAYNKTRPIALAEFEGERQWWSARVETDQAWRVSVEEIRDRNFNLDVKNPHKGDEDNQDVTEVLASFRTRERAVASAVEELRDALKQVLRGV